MADGRSPPTRSHSVLDGIFDALSTLEPLATESSEQPRSQHALSTLNLDPHRRSLLYRLSEDDRLKAKSLFLTLHVLFPHELLPALDILDRGLVNKLVPLPEPRIIDSEGNASRATHPAATSGQEHQVPWGCEVYYIQSSSAGSAPSHARGRPTQVRSVTTSSRSQARKPAKSIFYEVRLDSWNCTCPAFAVSAFQALVHPAPQGAATAEGDERLEEWSLPARSVSPRSLDYTGWAFGGVATKLDSESAIPSCKHMLAATLAKAAPRIFGPGVTEQRVATTDLAGWAGGWGELV